MSDHIRLPSHSELMIAKGMERAAVIAEKMQDEGVPWDYAEPKSIAAAIRAEIKS